MKTVCLVGKKMESVGTQTELMDASSQRLVWQKKVDSNVKIRYFTTVIIGLMCSSDKNTGNSDKDVGLPNYACACHVSDCLKWISRN